MAIAKLPTDFNPHRGIKKVFDSRQKMVESGEGIDWGFAEALAFGTLVSEGAPYFVICSWLPVSLPACAQRWLPVAGNAWHSCISSSVITRR